MQILCESETCTTIASLFHYLDDTFRGHSIESKAWKQFHHSERILKKLSLKTKDPKAKSPAQAQQWLGKSYDTKRQWLKVPRDKVDKDANDLKRALLKKSTLQKELLSHVGRSRHMASIYEPLAAFARKLERCAYSVKKLSHHIRMSRPLRMLSNYACGSLRERPNMEYHLTNF